MTRKRFLADRGALQFVVFITQQTQGNSTTEKSSFLSFAKTLWPRAISWTKWKLWRNQHGTSIFDSAQSVKQSVIYKMFKFS